jgi:molecular chaperone HscB
MENLFEILGLPQQFSLNLKTLEDAYFTAQGACHPDRFVGKPEMERMAAMSRSQWVNESYETLKNPLRRAEYLLELHGIFALSEDAQAPAALLMEMMELREHIADAASNGATLATAIADITARANATLAALDEAFKAGNYVAATEETLRLHYLGKAIEEAHMRVYRLKAAHAHD